MTDAASADFDIDRYGPWAVIAGGSEGVGARFAHRLAEAGVNLVLVARKAGPLEKTAADVARHGVEVRTVAADLTEADALARIRKQTDDVEVGLLVYNAGANTYGHEFVTGDLDRFRSVIDLNITAQLAIVQHFGAAMRERRRGGILLVGSMAGFLGKAQIGIYAAAKAFARVFAEGLWLELREYDVDVLELVLGVTRTPAMERAGLALDLPGMYVSDPDDVARQGLASLGNGPVVIAEGHEQLVQLQNGPDRRALVLGAHRAAQRLLPPSD
ncbi:MAG TPA: SDR family NAD(P)-dependent oxidoreductase [Marmoricola sp.]|nr:SDR family NAD(P)-dependent oxidoreductase [Marmoricola sp.]